MLHHFPWTPVRYKGFNFSTSLPTLAVLCLSGPQPFWHQGLVLWKTTFPWTGVRGDGFGMIQAHYIYSALHFYYYHIVIYNEIIIQLTIMQNQWEPWACFPATRWSHQGVMGDSDTWSVLLMSGLLCKMQLNCHSPLTDSVLIWVCKQGIYYGLCAVKPLCWWESVFAATPQR